MRKLSHYEIVAIRKDEAKRHRSGAARVTDPIFTGQRRDHVVERTKDALRGWQRSPFEREGGTVAGLRSNLCLGGYGWHRSDAEARGLVKDSLSLLGATRPTWEQGQRDYVEPRETCAWCSGEVDETLLHGKHHKRYCSDVCARSALQHRDFEERRLHDAGYAAAWDVVNRTRHTARPCKQCGKSFRPIHEYREAKFCSQACNGAFHRTLEEIGCRQCGTMFRPRHAGIVLCSTACARLDHRKDIPVRECVECGTEFRLHSMTDDARCCSRACRDRHGQVRKYSGVCLWCDAPFTAALPSARCCSQKCSAKVTNLRAGKIKRLTPPVFDYLFRQAA